MACPDRGPVPRNRSFFLAEVPHDPAGTGPRPQTAGECVFTLEATSGRARAGTLHLSHGSVPTPIFMPVGTRAVVKTLDGRDLEDLDPPILLGNTYHLYLRPGLDVLRAAGGLHRFMRWQRPILTDSGGFQIFSLAKLRKLHEEGASFQSHIDGSRHLFTPESVIEIQRVLGSDIMMVLDECPPGTADHAYVEGSLQRTLRWAGRCHTQWRATDALWGHQQFLYPIVQGGVFPDLRLQSIEALQEWDWPGLAIGGLSVGESKQAMREMTDLCGAHLPPDKPRYLMGVGTPEDILESIDLGVDQFDCVLPTRNARKATLFTTVGRVSAKSARHEFSVNQPLDPACACYTCRTYDRAYLRHLYHVEEFTAMRLGTIHNLHYFLDLVRGARQAILEDRWADYRDHMLAPYRNPEPRDTPNG
ncbi:MAG: tRNA guanosine(34) transglycosylase Tgt [Candidatus Delongbacteria bacterium]|nr:tRNA guanosine(34) transglycosylase Tgt [Candidatus Cloacimonadota bacterium]MCB9474676.1 tRNA guanosine(34) transglycosylase Tgt [Candidatus Delongbacteria bacterium]